MFVILHVNMLKQVGFAFQMVLVLLTNVEMSYKKDLKNVNKNTF